MKSKIKDFAKNNKVMIATAVAGIAVGSYIDDSFEKNRYPIRVEYQMISKCVNQYRSSNKVDQCICALEKTMSDIEYKNISNSSFGSTFEGYLRRCP